MRWRCLALLVVLALRAGPAWALGESCTAAATPMSFNSYNPLSAVPTDITATVTVTCSATAALLVGYTIELSSGNGSISNRTMLSDKYTLNYQLYSDAARKVVWGGGNSAQSDGYLLSAFAPVVRNYTAYGRIPAKQNVGAGSYIDAILVTVNY